MKRICICIFALLTFCFSPKVLAGGDNIKFGVMYFYPPFESRDALSLSYGFDIAIAQALCKQLQKVCIFQPMAFYQLFPALDDNTIDAAMGAILITDERKQKYNFTMPYYKGQMSFLTTIKKNIDYSQQGFTGKRVGTIRGTIFVDFLKANFPNIKLYTYDGTAEAMAALTSDELDLVLFDTFNVNWWVLNGDNQFKVVGTPIPLPEGGGYGVAVKKSNTNLLNQLNSAMQTILTNGTQQQIVETYLRFNP